MKVINIVFIGLVSLLLISTAHARPRDCHVNYVLDGGGTITTGWLYLGQVSGFLANKKKQCREMARQQCSRAKSKLLTYAPIGSANMQSICKNGMVGGVYFDTRVEGKKNSKDGTCNIPVSCKQTCSCHTGWYDGNRKSCVKGMCNVPGMTNGDKGGGYFAWKNNLYKDIPGAQCKYTGYN